MKKILELAKNSKVVWMISAFIFTCIIGIVDYLTGFGLTFSLFYLIAVAIVSWKTGRTAGVLLSIFAALLWCGGDFLAGKEYKYFFTPYWNFIITTCLFTVSAFMMSKLNTILEKEKRSARKDFLTDIANWQAFSEIATREIERSRRFGRPITVAYIDCDNFKDINDSFGHNAGNDFLRLIAKTICSNIRAVDMVARVGGDEFAILLPETDCPASEAVIARLQNILLSEINKEERSTTYSIGVATFNHAPDSVEGMIKIADGLMYEAKRSGKNTIRHQVFN